MRARLRNIECIYSGSGGYTRECYFKALATAAYAYGMSHPYRSHYLPQLRHARAGGYSVVWVANDTSKRCLMGTLNDVHPLA